MPGPALTALRRPQARVAREVPERRTLLRVLIRDGEAIDIEIIKRSSENLTLNAARQGERRRSDAEEGSTPHCRISEVAGRQAGRSKLAGTVALEAWRELFKPDSCSPTCQGQLSARSQLSGRLSGFQSQFNARQPVQSN